MSIQLNSKENPDHYYFVEMVSKKGDIAFYVEHVKWDATEQDSVVIGRTTMTALNFNKWYAEERRKGMKVVSK